MARRKTKNITNIKGSGQVDYTSVWRVFECGRPGCDYFLTVSEDAERFPDLFTLCPKCCFENDRRFIVRAARWKYCRICEWLQPLENFHKHKPNSSSFRSGRQLECAVCKNKKINPYLNPLRTTDQHRESSERRRLYGLIAGESKIDGRKIYERFGGKCFNCGKKLSYVRKGPASYKLDHTLPARFLWPLSQGATLRCATCNNEKHDKWPSEYYDEKKIRGLAVLSGIPYEILKGKPRLNPKAVERLKTNIDVFLTRWIKYANEIKNIRKLVLEMEGVDIYENALVVPDFLRNG